METPPQLSTSQSSFHRQLATTPTSPHTLHNGGRLPTLRTLPGTQSSSPTSPFALRKPVSPFLNSSSRSPKDGANSNGDATSAQLNLPEQTPKLIPTTALYWSKVETFGNIKPKPLRAHSMNVVGNKIVVFGGSDMNECSNEVWILDPYTFIWKRPVTTGEAPEAVRAHTANVVDKRLFVFGGGNGPHYFSQMYILDTESFVWSAPPSRPSAPCHRRAHSSCTYNNKIYIVFGGDGGKALDDVWVFDADPNVYTWSKLTTTGIPPAARGYHVSTLVGSKLIVHGGSDGLECFHDTWVLDLETSTWRQISTLSRAVPRLSHTATQVGPCIFVFGGHDGTKYSNEIVILNLGTMSWDTTYRIHGTMPKGRGYATSVLFDARLFILGGYDGQQVYDDLFILDLGSAAYLLGLEGVVGEAIGKSKA